MGIAQDHRLSKALRTGIANAFRKHPWFEMLLANTGQFSTALSECKTALGLAKADWLHQEEMQLEVDNIEDVIRRIRYVGKLPSP